MTWGKTRVILPARLKPSLKLWFQFSSMAKLRVSWILTVIFPLHLAPKTANWWNIARNSSESVWKNNQKAADNLNEKHNARPEKQFWTWKNMKRVVAALIFKDD